MNNRNAYSNKVGVSANNWYDLQVGLVLEHPAVICLVNDNVHEKGLIECRINSQTLWLTTGGLGQNNTHYLPKDTIIMNVKELDSARYCYLI